MCRFLWNDKKLGIEIRSLSNECDLDLLYQNGQTFLVRAEKIVVEHTLIIIQLHLNSQCDKRNKFILNNLIHT